MTRIAHLTDLHFGAHDPAVVAALREEIRSDRPDLVAISGDLTQGGRHAEFRAARAFMDSLGVPVLAVPGNHDITPYNLMERFTDPYARWRRAIGAETEPAWMDAEVAVVGLNTARRFGLNLDWSRGRVTHRRLNRLVDRLNSAPADRARIVIAHHPLLPPEAAPTTVVAGGAAFALRTMAAHGVVLVLAGHLHRGYARLATSDGRPPLVLQGSTATSVRLRGEPQAYHRVVVTRDGGVHVDIRSWDGAAFVTRLTHSGDTPVAGLILEDR